ncbi:MAG: peptidoglycan-binding protein [Alphaproteobacteria bacterium]|nr:peptidoglycan-binding protein [Alphaproteobacteria bacterium]
MPAPYDQSGLRLAEGSGNPRDLVKALQRDLRALGYLASGLDGVFGKGTARAVRALQWDLLFNTGASRGGDGRAPIGIATFNTDGRGDKAVTDLTGVVDKALAKCIAALLDDTRVTKLSAAADPKSANRDARDALFASGGGIAPTPFLAAMVRQESGGKHYQEPSEADDDAFVTVGLDRNDKANPDRITSRGYGIGQYTLFHHPPRPEEVSAFIVDPVGNTRKVFAEFREKFDRFLVGPADTADDRRVEHPLLSLRDCRYRPADPRYFKDCVNCARAARKIDIHPGTPFHAYATQGYRPDQYYPSATYLGVPDRADFPCDWPYAARRYNGSGNDSYHYQSRILLNLLALPSQDGSTP